jgi:hypothetical protein
LVRNAPVLSAAYVVRFADLPMIEGATGKFLLQQMAAVAELDRSFAGSPRAAVRHPWGGHSRARNRGRGKNLRLTHDLPD